MFDVSSKFNTFYSSHVVLSQDEKNKLYQKSDLNIKRLKGGLVEYNYGRFLPPERRRVAFNALLFSRGNYHNLLPQNKWKKNDRYLRYCPVCVKVDRERYRETYWHVCLTHGHVHRTVFHLSQHRLQNMVHRLCSEKDGD